LVRLEFGVKTGQGGHSYEELVKVWSAAEDLGFDSAWLYDHFVSLGDKNEPCLEGWVTLAALAAVTRRLKIGTLVTCVSYRQPSLLAKMGATVDQVSHGRLVMGLGAGWHQEEYEEYGYTFPDQGTRMRQLKETLIIINKMWTESKASYEGKFFQIHDAACEPKPVQKPCPKMLVGIAKGKRTLPCLAVKYADGFNVTASSLQECGEITNVTLQYAKTYGRKPSGLILSWQGFITIGRTPSELEQLTEIAAKRRGKTVAEFRKNAAERGYIIGQPDECTQRLRQFKDIGVNSFYLIFTGDTEIHPLETFRDEVIPQLR